MEPTEHFGIYFGYIRRLFQSWVSPFNDIQLHAKWHYRTVMPGVSVSVAFYPFWPLCIVQKVAKQMPVNLVRDNVKYEGKYVLCRDMHFGHITAGN